MSLGDQAGGTGSGAPRQLDAALVRVRSANGRVVGSGFLVGSNHVLTCAHVVADALGRPLDRAPGPDDRVQLDFSLVAPDRVMDAVVQAWQPVGEDERGDIAVLTLVNGPPAGALPARLVSPRDLWDHSFRAFGFPDGMDDGVWSTGRLRGRQSTGWVQMEGLPSTYAVQRGFSGGAVWDDDLAAVVGMIVAADTRSGSRAAFLIPTDLLAKVWPPLADRALPPSPYRGLYPFRAEDAEVFHGRQGMTQLLSREVRRRTVVAVVGPSGSGKSSVVFAGLVPYLERAGGWGFAFVRPSRGSSPTSGLALALLDLLEPGAREAERLAALDTVTELLVNGRLLDVAQRALTSKRAERLMIVVDQFEELFSRPAEQVTEFAQVLRSVAPTDREAPAGALSVVLTLRADFLGRALEDPTLTGVLHDAVTTIGQMTRDQLREVIESPLPQGVRYESGLVPRILDDVGTSAGSLPLLEFALTLLWERQEDGVLTHEAYEELGEVDGALARYAEQVFSEQVAPEDQAEARRLLIQLVRPTEVGVPVRRVARREDLTEQRWLLGQRLAGTRLLVTSSDQSGDSVELVHEALIGGWARLHDWVNEDLAFRTWQEQLRSTAAAWQKVGRDEGALLRGAPLVEAERWLRERPDDLSDADREFVVASRASRRRAGVRRTALVSVVGVLVVALVVGGGVLWRTWSGQSREDQAADLLSEAQQLRGSRPDVALLLAAAAYEKHATTETVRELTTQGSAWRHVERLLAPGVEGLFDLAFTEEPDVLALAGSNGVTLWNLVTRSAVMEHLIDGRLVDMASTPSGRELALLVQGDDQSVTLSLWSPQHPQRADELGLPRDLADERLGEIRLSPDGGTVGLCTSSGIHVWDTAPLRPRAVVPLPPTADLFGCSFDVLDGGRVLEVSGRDLRLWATEPPAPRVVTTVSGPPADPQSGTDQGLAVAGATPDGALALVTDTSTGGLVLVDLRTGATVLAPELQSLSTYPSGSIAFSADSRWAVIPSQLTAVRVDLLKRRVVSSQNLMAGGTSFIDSLHLAVSPDGRTTVSLAAPGVIAVARPQVGAGVPGHSGLGLAPMVEQPGSYASLEGDLRVVLYAADGSRREIVPALPLSAGTPADRTGDEPAPQGALSDDGRWLARTGTALDELTLARLPAGDIVPLGRHEGPVTTMVFSPGGRYLATADEAELVVWSVEERREVVRAALPGAARLIAALSPLGDTMVAIDRAGLTRIWRVTPQGVTADVEVAAGPGGGAAFSSDGAWLGVSTGEGVRLLDVEAGRLAEQRFPRSSPFGHVAFGPGGLFATTHEDGSGVSVWQIPDGGLVGQVAVASDVLFASGVLFLSSGDLVVPGEDLQPVPYRPEDARGLACTLVGGPHTPEDLERHVDELAYEDPCA